MVWKRALPRVLRVVWWLGVSLYFGGMLTLGAVVAPAVFRTTASAHMQMPEILSPPLDMSRQVGGEIFGACLNAFAWIEGITLGLMLLGWIGFMLRARRGWSTGALLVLWVLLAGCFAYDSTQLRPRVWSERTAYHASAAGHVTSGGNDSAAWPEQEEFESLHHRSESLGKVKAFLLLAMVVIAAGRSDVLMTEEPVANS